MSTRAGRRVRIPKTLQDFVPSSRTSLPTQYTSIIPAGPSPIPSSPSDVSTRSQSPAVEQTFDTDPDGFGVFRRYYRCPQKDPEGELPLDTVCDAPALERVSDEGSGDTETVPKNVAWLTRSPPLDGKTAGNAVPDYAPFDNASQFRLFDYFYGRSDVKSQDDINDLVALLRSDGFNVDDLKDFSAKKGERLLDEWAGHTSGVFSQEDGWHTSSVSISLPKVKGPGKKEVDAPQAEVHGIIHRRLLDIITGAVTDTTSRFARQYHWIPHIRYWIPDMPAQHSGRASSPANSEPSEQVSPSPMTGISDNDHTSSPRTPPPPIRIWTDCYNSDAMLEEDAKIRSMPRVPSDDPSVEYAVLPLLLWSDETHLSSFGSAYLWPIYLYFGSLSKYVRGRPTEFAAHHVAYIPRVRSVVLLM